MQSMVSQYRYELDGKPGSPKKKFNCPSCKAKGTFRRYFDYEKGAYLSDDVGLCDRANKCNYHLTPKEYFNTNPDKKEKANAFIDVSQYEPAKPVHIPSDVLTSTLTDYNRNSFVNALQPYFNKEQLEKAVSDYYLGTAGNTFLVDDGYLPSVFWYINAKGQIRAGQIKLFDESCSTAKYINSEGEKKSCTTWMHSIIKKVHQKKSEALPAWLNEYLEQPLKVDCLYGEHLLSKYPSKPIGLVEAPKTAVIAAMRYPDYLWLATSSLTYLTKERCQVLAGRKVHLFPDAGIPNPKNGKTCFELWRERVAEFAFLADFTVERIIEDHATDDEKQSGIDLADWILKGLKSRRIEISSKDIKQAPVTTRTSSDYGRLILQTLWLKDGRIYDVLFDNSGEYITNHTKLPQLAKDFNKTFHPATIDGVACLINQQFIQ